MGACKHHFDSRESMHGRMHVVCFPRRENLHGFRDLIHLILRMMITGVEQESRGCAPYSLHPRMQGFLVFFQQIMEKEKRLTYPLIIKYWDSI